MRTLAYSLQQIHLEHHAGDPPGDPPRLNTPISIGGRQICNLHFEDEVNLMGGSENELQYLTT